MLLVAVVLWWGGGIRVSRWVGEWAVDWLAGWLVGGPGGRLAGRASLEAPVPNSHRFTPRISLIIVTY